MNAKLVNRILTVVLVVSLGGMAAGTYVTRGLIMTKSKQLATAKARVDQLSAQQSSIAKSKRDIATYAQLETITKTIVPQDKDQAAAVLELTNIASANGVNLTTITFPTSTLGTTKSGTVTAPNAASLTKPSLSQLTPVPGIPGVYTLLITVGNNANTPVTYNQFTNFLRALENNRRTATVGSINILPQATNHNNLLFTLTLNIYIKP